MAYANKVRVRRSITELQAAFEAGDRKPLEDLMRAWRAIKALPPDDPNSFFMIGGYHGEPFRGAGWGSSSYWGGYCNHGNVLFPTWHRVYLLRLEQALQSVPGCEEVTLPFWDETSEDSLKNGIPWALTKKDFVLDGQTIANPLRSFVLNKPIKDSINGDDPNYSKPKGYETVRYPLSGLVGTPADQAATEKHNAQYPDYNENVVLLNQNIVTWLNSIVEVPGHTSPGGKVADKYKACLEAPNYTVFSNTTSASQWNVDHPSDEGWPVVRPLESPHNSIHLAVGGYDVPSGPNQGDDSPIQGANGDMGENDTAGLDPIFYFHHCFVDRVFWLWQKRHGFTKRLEVIAGYPGTNSVDSQGPTPGTVPNSWLSLDSPLDPFKLTENGRTRPYTSLDCIDIEEQLGYTYGPGSLEDLPAPKEAASRRGGGRSLHVSGINRAPIRGSFVVSIWGTVDGQRVLLDTEAVLSRWSVQYCANCQTHLEVKAFAALDDYSPEQLAGATFEVELRTRDGVLGESSTGKAAQAMPAKPPQRLYRVELR